LPLEEQQRLVSRIDAEAHALRQQIPTTRAHFVGPRHASATGAWTDDTRAMRNE